MACPESVVGTEWRSVSVRPAPSGLTARETFDRFKVERITELALRVAGIAMIAGAVLVWFLGDPRTDANATLGPGPLGSFMVVGGLAVFAFGKRRFRREISLDVDSGTLCLSKINMQDQARASQQIKLGDIESVFLRRAEAPRRQSTLLIRLAGQSAPVIGLSGNTREIESLHRQLCAVMRSAQGTAMQAALHLDDDHTGKRRLFSA